MTSKILTQADIKRLFEYQDGYLVRRVSTARRVKVGDYAGSLNTKGYLQTKIHGRPYLNHRLIWLLHFGYMPENGLDHIDRDRTNNRIWNLREVSIQCNNRNTGNPARNTSGVKGVSWHGRRRKWQADIRINHKTFYLGLFDDFTEAVAHRLAAEQCIDWSNCDSNSPAFQYISETKRRIK